MSVEEKFLRYVKIDTQSDPDHEEETPSSKKQFNLARLLKDELHDLGIHNAEVDDHGYVYAWLESNLDTPSKTVGFVAHMDTAPDFSGTDVQPKIIESYDGKDIPLGNGRTLSPEQFPDLKELVGKRLITTDGSTLLGGDDKAGMSAIMEAVETLVNHPEIKHGRIAICFTPDEEIGNGPKYFDIKKFGADFAYTMDGGDIRGYSDETFNAASAVINFTGFSIHPGSAKNHMINAAAIACQFQSFLPDYMTPEHTEGHEGFIHLIGMEGNTSSSQLEYIIRDHDLNKLEEKKHLLEETANYINTLYGKKICTIILKDEYRNMKEVLKDHPEVKEIAYRAFNALGIDAYNELIRGGTDGAVLSARGLPCPNLGNGDRNCHGPYEYVVVEEMEQACQLILEIVHQVEEASL